MPRPEKKDLDVTKKRVREGSGDSGGPGSGPNSLLAGFLRFVTNGPLSRLILGTDTHWNALGHIDNCTQRTAFADITSVVA